MDKTYFGMKRYLVMCAVVALLACNNKKPAPGSPGAEPIVNNGGNSTDETGGEKLIAKSDCMGCHSQHSTVTGPPFENIARRYPNGTGVAENLAKSIISGSRGIWGNVQEMPPHPNVSQPDAVKMAKYILSLKDKMKQDSASKVR